MTKADIKPDIVPDKKREDARDTNPLTDAELGVVAGGSPQRFFDPLGFRHKQVVPKQGGRII